MHIPRSFFSCIVTLLFFLFYVLVFPEMEPGNHMLRSGCDSGGSGISSNGNGNSDSDSGDNNPRLSVLFLLPTSASQDTLRYFLTMEIL